MINPTLGSIILAVAEYYHQDAKALVSHRRFASAARARQVAAYLCRKHTDYTLEEIGTSLGHRDHTTILHGVRVVESRLNVGSEEDRALLAAQIEAIELSVGLRPSVPLLPSAGGGFIVEFENTSTSRVDPDVYMRRMLKSSLRRFGFRAKSVKRIAAVAASVVE